jgi:hypothetical protein
MAIWDVDDGAGAIVAVRAVSTLKIPDLKRIKQLLIILDVEEPVGVCVDKIVFLFRVRAEVNLVATDDGRRVLVVAYATGLEFHPDGLALITKVH